MSKSILKIKGLKKTYSSGPQEVEVLKGLDLEINQGEIVVIMGPSGVGKSTLLHLIGGLDFPTEGEVFLNDINIFELNNAALAEFRNKSIGFVFQFHHLLPEFTAFENLLIPGMISKKDLAGLESRVEELLNDVGLKHRQSHKPSELSGGDQQRVAVARALVNEPQLILADEPTGNLDKNNSESLYKLILELNKRINQTFIIVTHNELMAEHASCVIELEDGKIKNHLRK